MTRKNVIWKVLLAVFTLIALGLSADIFHKFQIRKQSWNEQMRTTFISALENNLEARGRENLYIASESSGRRQYKEDSLIMVVVNAGEGDKEYAIPSYKHYNNIAESPAERLFDGVIIEDHPLKVDSLWVLWDSLLTRNSISDQVNIRISAMDLSENVSVVYARDNQLLLPTDSLFSYYIGYRCEVEVTGFATFSYWNTLFLWDWMELFSLLLIGGLFLWRLYIYKIQFADNSELPELIVIEKEIPVIALKEENSHIYQLGNDLFFDATERLLRRGEQKKKLLPQVSTLLVGLLKADDYRMSISEICLLLWPDGSGTAERVHTVVGRLRAALSEISSGISVDSGNFQYQLKMPHFIE